LNGFALARSITTKINKRHRKNPQSQNFVVNHPTHGLGLKNRQVGEKWVYDDYSYLCKGF
jgi:hypothetical protein